MQPNELITILQKSFRLPNFINTVPINTIEKAMIGFKYFRIIVSYKL